MHQYESKQALLVVFCSSVLNATSIMCRNCIILMMKKKKNQDNLKIYFSKNEENENFANLKFRCTNTIFLGQCVYIYFLSKLFD